MTPPTASPANRRRVLAAGLGGGFAMAVAGGVEAASALDLSTPKARLEAFMRMRGALDGRLVIGFVSGRYYGVVDDEMRPLFGVQGATFARYRARSDGGYDGASYEISYFTDLETGAVLERFANPYTKDVVEVPRNNYPPAALVVTPTLEIQVAKPPPGLVMNSRVRAPIVAAGEVWMTEETTSTFTVPGLPKPVRYGELVTLHARAADLAASRAPRVRCDTGFTAIVGWRPWLKMGDRPGHLVANGAGRYGVTLEELPAEWRVGAAKYRPEALRTPGLPLDGLLRS